MASDSSSPPSDTHEKRPFLRAAGLVGAITLLSRFLGLIRDMVLAACLGSTRVADIFWIAFELPNLARRVLGEGSLSAFIVPIVTKARSEEGKEAAWRFASNALTVLGALSLGLTALGILGARPLFSLFGYGYFERNDAEAIALGVRLTRIMFPFLMLLALSSILMGLCHSIRHFATPALGSVMLNISMIAAGLTFFTLPESRFAVCLAVAVLVGGLLRLLIMIPPLARAGFRYHPVFEPASPRMRQLGLMLLPALFGLAVVQINISISRAFATHLGEGFVPCLLFSNRLVQLPLAIVASALATAILPQLSLFWTEGRTDDLRRLVGFAFRLVLIVFVPATVGLMVLGHPIIQVLFQRANWDAQSTTWTYQALLFYAPALVAWGMMRILIPIYYARHDVRTPVAIAALAMLANVALNVVLVTVDPIREALGHAGLALGNTIGVLLNTSLLLWILRRRGLALWDADLTVTLARTLVAAGAMGLMTWALWRGIGQRALDTSPVTGVAALAATIAASAGVYLLAAWVLRVPDLREALALVLRRGRKRD